MSGDVSIIDPSPLGTDEAGSRSSWSGWSDWAGVVASIGCAIHCAAMPFLIAYLPAFGMSFLADEAFHQWMAIGCFAIALTAFVPGLRRHRSLTPVIVGSVGLVMISTAAFGFAGECCAACENDVASAGLATSGLSEPPVSAETCVDDCCPLCANDGSPPASAGDSIAAVDSAELPIRSSALGQLLSRIAPWLTPLGGCVLVAAHLLNRRFGSLCECCETESGEGIA